MRVVFDTNVIVSATLIRSGNEDRVLRAWQHGTFELVLSPPILEEMGRALFYERIRERSWMTDNEVVELLEALAAASVLVPGRSRVRARRRQVSRGCARSEGGLRCNRRPGPSCGKTLPERTHRPPRDISQASSWPRHSRLTKRRAGALFRQ